MPDETYATRAELNGLGSRLSSLDSEFREHKGGADSDMRHVTQTMEKVEGQVEELFRGQTSIKVTVAKAVGGLAALMVFLQLLAMFGPKLWGH